MTITITTKSTAKAHLLRAKAFELLNSVRTSYNTTCGDLVSPVLGRDLYTVFIASSGSNPPGLKEAKDNLIKFAEKDSQSYAVSVKRWYD